MSAHWNRLFLLLGLLLLGSAASAHESRPAYLEIDELGANKCTVLWHTPVTSGMILPVRLRLPNDMASLSPPVIRDLTDSRVETRLVRCAGGLPGKHIAFDGLEATITDVLVRVQFANGQQFSALVHPSNAMIEIPADQGAFTVARTYVALGIEHILTGWDHLFFITALFLLVANLRTLFWTITSFTLAHSITLALVTLDVIRVPPPPVEAVIALSIVFVAVEVVRKTQGHASLASRKPWLIAFTFGLLHGMGFASALAEVGLPRNNVPLALLFFNVGVEIGQITFVSALLAVSLIAKRFARPAQLSAARLATCYAIGGIASFWLLQRVSNFA
jgi:hydrogenase/urease accessory protein HupE